MTRRFEQGIDNRLALYAAIRAASGAELVVDSSKEYLHGYAVYKRQPAQTRLILLTRDGRAVFNSNLRRGFTQDYALKVWRNYYRFTLLALGRAVDPTHVFTLRYEDLAMNAAGTMAAICKFANLEFSAQMLQPGSRMHHITSGNNMRFTGASEVQLDIKWQRELSAVNRHYFERHAGALNRQLGYS